MGPQVQYDDLMSISEDFRTQLRNVAKVFDSALGGTAIAIISDIGADMDAMNSFQNNYLFLRRAELI
jgi:hypothetical protein